VPAIVVGGVNRHHAWRDQVVGWSFVEPAAHAALSVVLSRRFVRIAVDDHRP
jgi:hypothetical protein